MWLKINKGFVGGNETSEKLKNSPCHIHYSV